MRKSKRRRKSSVNESYLLVIAICALSFIVMIKQMFISISTSLANLSVSAQLSLLLVAITSVILVLRFKNTKSKTNYKNQYSNNIDYMQLSDYEFEQYCSNLLNALGYKTKVTARKNDGGKDLIGTDPQGDKIYGEVKQWSTTAVGRPVLQKLRGAMADANVSKGIFITTSRFSQQALEYAYRNNIKCVDRIELNRMIRKAKRM